MIETINFPSRRSFYDANDFELAIKKLKFSELPFISHVEIKIGRDCKFLADATLKLLCLCHHVVSLGRNLTLTFEGGACNCFTFLERCGFFHSLPQETVVTPYRPQAQDASIAYAGQSANLLEIRAVSPTNPSANRPIPSQLTDALGTLIKTDCDTFLSNIQTVVSEFCSNVSEHSQVSIPGFVYMHHYPASGNIYISIADLGVGLLNSLREGLQLRNHWAKDLPDQNLILEMFNEGLSRKHDGRGTGLNRAANIAIQFDGRLHVRLDRHVIDLYPNGSRFEAAATATALMSTDCFLAKGTHITLCFSRTKL
ncbi:hypothetical protein AMS64_02575 [Aeromonas veronii]|uniref:ATP-binding protein n=1 Tax=Aeromonas veronii TaxID=654 RepID=UPI00078EE755|nr:ATP-binding protein [Aeromonas veronii]AMQ41354.1 hypothetical protein AMS64_02575 [Aeromonas veronii]MCX0426081.1 sensor histidine kinase [Aeromonas veronii]MCX0446691.1 sensor histidine kinase [Aeromonas veronii]POG18207.1 ATP-binding protein [Aeromonas veronii]